MGNDGRGRHAHITRYECGIENYSHVESVERKGFDKGAKVKLYGKGGLAKVSSEEAHMQRLCDEREVRRRQLADERKRTKRVHCSRKRSNQQRERGS